ncbi:hypothetical protein ACPW96_06390 [Micromonospora sp. DT81.3]|uniref:hypothetical protein n=1 Tax=Actinomycetes TaxID=1760 RepID=UPI003CF4C4B4
MPREFILVSERSPDTDDLRAAAGALGHTVTIARAKAGALDLVLDGEGRVLLSVEYTQRIAVPDEIERLAPAASSLLPGPVFWTECWAPFGADGEVGERIAEGVARACGGVCVKEDGGL